MDHIYTTVKSKQHVKWLVFGILVFALFCIVAVQSMPESSEASIQINSVDSGYKEIHPRIEAICISGYGQPSAYVGGKFVREDDTVNGFKILRIYPNKVEFGKNGNTVIGVFPDKRRPSKPEPDNFLQNQINYKSPSNYQIQHKQPTYSSPHIAENGSYYGQISENTGRPKTVYVRGYYRKDGTYVRSHYRSPPR